MNTTSINEILDIPENFNTLDELPKWLHFGVVCEHDTGILCGKRFNYLKTALYTLIASKGKNLRKDPQDAVRAGSEMWLAQIDAHNAALQDYDNAIKEALK